MAELEKISSLEEVYFQLQTIKMQVVALENFILSHLDRDDQKPVKPVMIDPRSNEEFKSKIRKKHAKS